MGSMSLQGMTRLAHFVVKGKTFVLRILRGKKHPQIKLQCLRKCEYGHLDNQVFKKVLIPKQNFRKNKVVTGKTLLFVICPLRTRHSIYLKIGF